MEHLADAFAAARHERRAAVIPYLVAGWPSWRRCRELVWDAQEAGADAIELGIPFSDPVADGPTIQGAIHEALHRGVTPQRVLRFVRAMRAEGLEVPLVGMTYANLLFAPGYARSARDWARAGLDGAIVPDVPVDEAAPLRAALGREGLATVFFASPSTSPERIRRAIRASTGFLYLVAVYGVTGERRGLAPETAPLVGRVRRLRSGSAPPICVGFGVSRPPHVAALRRAGADGVIVGSALVARVARGDGIRSYLGALRRAALVSRHAR